MKHAIRNVEGVFGGGFHGRSRRLLLYALEACVLERAFGRRRVHRDADGALDLVVQKMNLSLDVGLRPSKAVPLRPVQLRHQSLHVSAVAEQVGILAFRFADHGELRGK